MKCLRCGEEFDPGDLTEGYCEECGGVLRRRLGEAIYYLFSSDEVGYLKEIGAVD